MSTGSIGNKIVNQTFNDIEFRRALHDEDVTGYLDIPTMMSESSLSRRWRF